MIKITANSTWSKQAVLLMMQFEKHMSKHKWNGLLKTTAVRVAEHSTVGWKAVNKELWLLSSLLTALHVTFCSTWAAQPQQHLQVQ